MFFACTFQPKANSLSVQTIMANKTLSDSYKVDCLLQIKRKGFWLSKFQADVSDNSIEAQCWCSCCKDQGYYHSAT